jgi:hypothetical protein
MEAQMDTTHTQRHLNIQNIASVALLLYSVEQVRVNTSRGRADHCLCIVIMSYCANMRLREC